jgi:hypothetical protein
MSAWHREHPELAGGPADPWMRHGSYRAARASLIRERHITCPTCDDRRVVPVDAGDDGGADMFPCPTCRPEAA